MPRTCWCPPPPLSPVPGPARRSTPRAAMPTPPVCPRRRSAAPRLIACATPPSSDATKPLSSGGTFRLALLSGAVAGFTVDAVLFPLDTLKTRLQVSSRAAAAASQRAALLSGLYAGFGPAVLASAPAAAAFFGVYDYVKRALDARFGERVPPRCTPLLHMVAAAAGDVASSTVRVPFEVVKQRLQTGMYQSPVGAVRSILAKEGVGGFFSGYVSLVVRELPFDAIQFPLYEYLKTVGARRKGAPLATWESSVCGSVAGGISAAVTTPLDVVKTRLMTQSTVAPKYKGLLHGLSTIAREEGASTLMSGVAPRVIWISLGGAIFFGAYEAARKAIFPIIAKKETDGRGKDRKA